MTELSKPTESTPPSVRDDDNAMDKSGASLGDQLRYLPHRMIPQRLMTRAFHAITRVRAPWFKNTLTRALIRIFNIDMSDAENPDPRSYETFNHFFTRSLRPDARPIAAGERVISSPVDGRVSQAGPIAGDRMFQAKGQSYSLLELLGGDEAQAAMFHGGRFTTLYLSPRDYHRIHMPVTGTLRAMTHIPGKLFSVSPLTTRVVPRLFARNERVNCLFDTADGPMLMSLVGAVNVASIETVWAGVITPPLGRRIRSWSYPEEGGEPLTLERGVEMGRFNTGSTVILLFPPGVNSWAESLRPGDPIRMGAHIGDLV
jgi:phosphatidylserine decarboxylase